MNHTGIQSDLAKIEAMLVDAGLKGTSSADFTIRPNGRNFVYITNNSAKYFDGGHSKFFHGDNPEAQLQAAKDYIATIPTQEERDKAEFTKLLAQVIEKGNDIGLPVDFMNPLTESMKRLSENALTDQREW